MARRTTEPVPPRPSIPDLPASLEPHDGWEGRADLLGVRVAGLSGDVSAVHGRLVESRVDGASVERLEATGTALVDVGFADIRATTLSARDGSWRSVEVAGGRIATLDASRSTWDGVWLHDLRVDYLNLAGAEASDLRITGCRIGSLDLPEARLTRVRFEDSSVDEVDTRGLRAEHVDLRGLEALSFTDPRGLAGATLDPRQAQALGAVFAGALGIHVSA